MYALPLACLLIAFGAFLWARGVTQDRTGGDAIEEEAAVLGESDQSATDESDEQLREALDIADDLASGSAAASSSGASFLADLEKAAAKRTDADDEASAVAWSEERALPEMAADVLRAYRDKGGASLVTSGYMDLSGNVWAALLRWDGGDVDIVMASTADDQTSEVHVVRLVPDGI